MPYDIEAARAALQKRTDAVYESNSLKNHGVPLWDIKMPVLKRKLDGHNRKIMALSWSEDSKHILAADQCGKIILWDVMNAMRLKMMDKSFTMSVALHPTKPLAASGDMHNLVQIYDTSDSSTCGCTLIKEFEGHDGYVGSIAFANGSTMLTTGGDGVIMSWDVEKNKGPVTKWIGHPCDATSITFPKDKSCSFATCSTDQSVRVWDLRTGKMSHYFKTSGEVNSCAFLPSGLGVAAGCQNGESFLFDLRSMNQIQKFVRKNAHTTAVDFSASGRVFYCAYEDGYVGLWDTFGSGAYKQKLDAHFSGNALSKEKIVSCLKVAPDGTAIATGGFDALMKIWGPPAASPK